MATWRVPTKEELQLAARAGCNPQHLMVNRDVTDGVMMLDLKNRIEILATKVGNQWKVTVFSNA